MPVANLLRSQPAPPISQSSEDSSKAGAAPAESSFSHKLARAKTKVETTKAHTTAAKPATAQPPKPAVKSAAPVKPGEPGKSVAPEGTEASQEVDGADNASPAGKPAGSDTAELTDGPDAEEAEETAEAATGQVSARVKQAIAAAPPAGQKKLARSISGQLNQADDQKNSDAGAIVSNLAAQVPTPADAGNVPGGNSAAVQDGDSIDLAPALAARYGTGKVVASPEGDSAQDGSSPANATDGSNAPAGGGATAIDPALEAVATPMAVIAEAGGKGGDSVDTQSNTSAVPSGISALTGDEGLAPAVGKASSPTASPQVQFVETNQPKILSSIQGQLLPNGGTMQIRLTPPELGNLNVTVQMRDGVMAASFETSSDHATKLLSHSLGQLKSGLEAAGVSVEKLQVQQSPRQDAGGEGDSDSKQQPQEQQQQSQQDQQRREMLQRMWRKLTGASDPLDLVA